MLCFEYNKMLYIFSILLIINANLYIMSLDDFKKNVITQKNVITKKEFVNGGSFAGTQTTKPYKTNTTISAILEWIYGNDYGTQNDASGDWYDEGTC